LRRKYIPDSARTSLSNDDRKYSETSGAYEEGLAMKRYVVVIEETGNGYGAFVPDLPGCVAAGDTYEETKELIREAIPFHIESLHANGDPIPEPTTRIEFVDAETAA
jgi:predicted RNase H-like HicB family nuclease